MTHSFRIIAAPTGAAILSGRVPVAPMVSQGQERRRMQVMSKSSDSFVTRDSQGTWKRPANRATFAHLFPESCSRSPVGFACLTTAGYGQNRTTSILRSTGFAEPADGTRCFGFISYVPGSKTGRPAGAEPDRARLLDQCRAWAQAIRQQKGQG